MPSGTVMLLSFSQLTNRSFSSVMILSGITMLSMDRQHKKAPAPIESFPLSGRSMDGRLVQFSKA